MGKFKWGFAGDEVSGAVDAAGDVAEIWLIERKIREDLQEHDLTDDEVKELRDAYVLEDEYEGSVHVFRDVNNKIRERNGKPKLRTSQEIFDEAKKKKKEEDQTQILSVPNQKLPQDVGSERDVKPTTVPKPSLLDYYR